MDLVRLYKLYGNYTPEGRFIVSHKKYHDTVTNLDKSKKMRRRIKYRWAYLLIPFMGIVLYSIALDDFGLE